MDKSPSQKTFSIEEEKKNENQSIDEFIRETQKNSANSEKGLKWIDFETFENIKQIGEGGFAKVYSATWLDGEKKLIFTDPATKVKKIRTLPNIVALKSIKGSNQISSEYLNEMETYYKLTLENRPLPFYGITRDPNSSEFMMVTGLASNGSLRSLLAKSFTELSWKDKISALSYIIKDLESLHKQGICHKDFHSGNILRGIGRYHVTDFGLAGPSNKSSEEIYGVLGYVAPELLKSKQYDTPADIYSFGIVMTELSSGFQPYSNKDMNDERVLILSILKGLRPDFGKGTPEIYKNLACKCMDANPNERPTASQLENVISYWSDCIAEEKNDDDAKKIKVAFDIADKEIPNVQSLFEKKSDVKYVSKLLTTQPNISVYHDHDLAELEFDLDDLDDYK